MRTVFDPFSFLVVCIAGWMNQRQRQVIDYLVEENCVPREQVGARRSPSNILVWPLDGGAPRPLTHFIDGGRMLDFAWSYDGNQLALWRAIVTSEIVMLKGLP